MQRVIAARKNKPMFLIDIAVPRNIDPAVNDVEGVFLYDVDDLEGVVNANIKERAKQAEQAEAIVADEVERMMSRLKLEEVTPTIISLQEQLENIRAGGSGAGSAAHAGADTRASAGWSRRRWKR